MLTGQITKQGTLREAPYIDVTTSFKPYPVKALTPISHKPSSILTDTDNLNLIQGRGYSLKLSYDAILLEIRQDGCMTLSEADFYLYAFVDLLSNAFFISKRLSRNLSRGRLSKSVLIQNEDSGSGYIINISIPLSTGGMTTFRNAFRKVTLSISDSDSWIILQLISFLESIEKVSRLLKCEFVLNFLVRERDSVKGLRDFLFGEIGVSRGRKGNYRRNRLPYGDLIYQSKGRRLILYERMRGRSGRRAHYLRLHFQYSSYYLKKFGLDSLESLLDVSGLFLLEGLKFEHAEYEELLQDRLRRKKFGAHFNKGQLIQGAA